MRTCCLLPHHTAACALQQQQLVWMCACSGHGCVHRVYCCFLLLAPLFNPALLGSADWGLAGGQACLALAGFLSSFPLAFRPHNLQLFHPHPPHPFLSFPHWHWQASSHGPGERGAAGHARSPLPPLALHCCTTARTLPPAPLLRCGLSPTHRRSPAILPPVVHAPAGSTAPEGWVPRASPAPPGASGAGLFLLCVPCLHECCCPSCAGYFRCCSSPPNV